jgi:hypothetical protein
MLRLPWDTRDGIDLLFSGAQVLDSRAYAFQKHITC